MIHPSAIIHPSAQIDDGVQIGPYCIIEKNVRLARGNFLHSHVCLGENSSFQEDNFFFPHCAIGLEPQDKKYKKGDEVFLEVGKNNIFRENVTVNRGTLQDKNTKGYTKIGNGNLLMAYVHIAHDCILHDDIILANNVSLAGHVSIQSKANLGGFCLINQFRTVGQYVFVGMGCAINNNLIPFMSYSNVNSEFKLRSLNLVGLKRANFSQSVIIKLQEIAKKIADKTLSSETKKEYIKEQLEKNMDLIELKIILDFINHPKSKKYGICY